MSSKLLESLLDAIVRLDADALVMHVGDKPYVVTTSAAPAEYRGPLAWGQVELSSRVLTSEAVLGLLGQLLPAEQQQALEEFGAIEHAIPAPENAADRFTIVAARSGDDVWLEVRRKPLIPARPNVLSEPQPAMQEAEAQPVERPSSLRTPVAQAPDAAAVTPVPVLIVEEEEDEEDEDTDGDPHVLQPATDDQEEVVFELSLDAIVPPAPTVSAASAPSMEIVHDETQSAPTDDEVDALLAATAATLLAASKSPAPTPVAAVSVLVAVAAVLAHGCSPVCLVALGWLLSGLAADVEDPLDRGDGGADRDDRESEEQEE